MSPDGSDGQEHGGHDRKQPIGVTPALVVDDPLDHRHHDERSGADAGHGEAQRKRSPRFEPAADRGDRADREYSILVLHCKYKPY